MRGHEADANFDIITDAAARIDPKNRKLTGVIYQWCHLCDEEHRASDRQFMHVFHHPKVVCVSSSGLCRLSSHQFCGLVCHELGHMLAGKRASEERADQAAEAFFRVKIRYDKKRIQYLTIEDMLRLVKLAEQYWDQ